MYSWDLGRYVSGPNDLGLLDHFKKILFCAIGFHATSVRKQNKALEL